MCGSCSIGNSGPESPTGRDYSSSKGWAMYNCPCRCGDDKNYRVHGQPPPQLNPAPFRKCCVNGVTLGCGKALNCLGRVAMTQAYG